VSFFVLTRHCRKRTIKKNISHEQRTRAAASTPKEENSMVTCLRRLWAEEEAQDIAEYAVMLAVILVLVVGTVQLVGSNANTAFSTVASTLGTQ
jgi:Flp pilus assembly pilin Flp